MVIGRTGGYGPSYTTPTGNFTESWILITSKVILFFTLLYVIVNNKSIHAPLNGMGYDFSSFLKSCPGPFEGVSFLLELILALKLKFSNFFNGIPKLCSYTDTKIKCFIWGFMQDMSVAIVKQKYYLILSKDWFLIHLIENRGVMSSLQMPTYWHQLTICRQYCLSKQISHI